MTQLLVANDKSQTEYALAKRLRNWGTFLLISLAMALTPVIAQTTAFTYQGTIEDGGQPANGAYDLEFALFDDPSSGTQTGNSITLDGVQVVDGAFSVKLDFGSEFPGEGRWLEIRIRKAAPSSGSEVVGGFTLLTPRQAVMSAPYSIKSLSAVNATTAANALQLDGTDADQFVLTSDPRMTDERTPTSGSGSYVQNTTTQQATSNFNISGTGKAEILDVTTQYNIGGIRILSNPGTGNLFAGMFAGTANTSGSNSSFFGYLTGYSNTTGIDNSFFGSGAGYLNTTGDNNSFFGRQAGRNTTTGSNNSFFGFQSGILNTEGYDNSFFGRLTGGYNTTGIENSFFGSGAGFLNTTGNSNSFFGRTAGRNNTEGSYNSFLGMNAGRENTTGNYNSFFGFESGRENTTGQANSFYGRFSGAANTTGSSNVFVGIDAGLMNTVGNFNSFLGFKAGGNNGSGGANSFFGSTAGLANTTGAFNSFFGDRAGYSNSTGAYNSYFGKNAGESGTTGYGNSFFGDRAGDSNTTGGHNTTIGAGSDVDSGDLTYATAIGAGAMVTTSNTIQLGRDGIDIVRIGNGGTGGITPLCVKASLVLAACSSSIRYKSNVEDFRTGLSLIRKLRPVSFNWKDGGMLDLGLVAEEVNAVEPLLTTINANGQVEGVKYDRVGVVLINVVKEQQETIEVQSSRLKVQSKELQVQSSRLKVQGDRINQLEADLATLKALVCASNPGASVCQ